MYTFCHNLIPPIRFGGYSSKNADLILAWGDIISLPSNPYHSKCLGVEFINIFIHYSVDPKHKLKLLTQWFKYHGIDVMPWPSQSPDANPIGTIHKLHDWIGWVM